MNTLTPPHEVPPGTLIIDGQPWQIRSWHEARISTPVAPDGRFRKGARLVISREGEADRERYICIASPETCVANFPTVTSLRPHVAKHTMEARRAKEAAERESTLTEEDRKANGHLLTTMEEIRTTTPVTAHPATPFTPAPNIEQKDSTLEDIVSRMGEIERDTGWLVGELTSLSDKLAELRNDIEKASENVRTPKDLREIRRKAQQFDAMAAMMKSGSEDDG